MEITLKSILREAMEKKYFMPLYLERMFNIAYIHALITFIRSLKMMISDYRTIMLLKFRTTA